MYVCHLSIIMFENMLLPFTFSTEICFAGSQVQ